MTVEPPITFSTSGSASATDINLKEIVDKLLLVLSEKEKYIIQHRFSVNVGSKKTLEAIGQHYGVTRERIRQIEKNALKKLKRNAVNTNLKAINEVGKDVIRKHGNLLVETKLVKVLLGMLKNIPADHSNELKLSLALDPELIKANNTLDFEPHWRFENVSLGDIRKVTATGYKVLNGNKDIMSINELTSAVQSKITEDVSEAFIVSSMEIGKRTKFVKEGVGLKEWRHINPRTLRDKINFILDREHKPLHFQEIADKIIDANFDQKRVNVQAVHNELIRNSHFVLIGRGIYALDKWGFKPGTVGDVIQAILKDGKARTREEIMKEVLKQRHVKKITIYLNLKNNARIKSLEGDRYQLA
jgi:hypothetical protein